MRQLTIIVFLMGFLFCFGTSSFAATASLLGTDITTQGNWMGIYGTVGYDIPNSISKVATDGTVFNPGAASLYTWGTNVSSTSALKTGTSTDVASAWYNNLGTTIPSLTLDVVVPSGQSQTVALYFLDFDKQGRAESVSVTDVSGTPLAGPFTVSGTYFTNGEYLVLAVSGEVHVTVTLANGPNAVVSGVFFGVSSTTPPPVSSNGAVTISGNNLSMIMTGCPAVGSVALPPNVIMTTDTASPCNPATDFALAAVSCTPAFEQECGTANQQTTLNETTLNAKDQVTINLGGSNPALVVSDAAAGGCPAGVGTCIDLEVPTYSTGPLHANAGVYINGNSITSSSCLPFPVLCAPETTLYIGDFVHLENSTSISGGFAVTGGAIIGGGINVTGDVTVTGNLSVSGTKNFQIDDPLDPANKYLVHASIESSEMMNMYTGNIATDAHGMAVVKLPDWFEALNYDFRYQLTVIGQFAQAIVAKEIENNQFSIKTNKPNVRVSWQVTGLRHDAYAAANPMQVEEEKTVADQKHYIGPEPSGQPGQKPAGMIQKRPALAPDTQNQKPMSAENQ